MQSSEKKASCDPAAVTKGQVGRRDFLKGLAVLGGASTVAAMMPRMLAAANEGDVARPPEAGAGAMSGETKPNNVLPATRPLEVVNGWYVQNGKVIWGYSHHNQWWGGYRGEPHGWWSDVRLTPCIIRNANGQVGPNKTEDLDKLTDSMVEYGFPGYEHTPPLWMDRRRDTHEAQRRANADVAYPLMEMPWGRSDQGRAWDGLPLYDLTQFNPWFFSRLKTFADLCDRKECILFFNFYNQHNLVRTQAHYCDYPWRPTNCIQATDMPDTISMTAAATDAFYDVTHPLRRKLHQLYIRHCLDVLGDNRNVVFLPGLEFSGPLPFVQFWLDTILEWQEQTGKKAHIGLAGARNVADAVLQDPRYISHIGTIKDIPGRDRLLEYRRKYPDKAIVLGAGSSQEQVMTFLMSGGSMMVSSMHYVPEYPAGYETPLGCENIMVIYNFIRAHVAEDLAGMRPLDIINKEKRDAVWCLGEPGKNYLIYMPRGDLSFTADLSDSPGVYEFKWVGMGVGTIFEVYESSVEGGRVLRLSGLDQRPWMIWLKRRA